MAIRDLTGGLPVNTDPYTISHGTPGVGGIGSGAGVVGVYSPYSSNLAAPSTSSSSSTSGGGARSQQSSQHSSQSTSQSGSYFSNPALVDSLARQFGGLYESVVPVYQNFMADPVNSNTFQTQLRSLLASLAPGEEDSRNQLTDRFRAAGGLRSGAHAVSGARLEGDIIGRRQNAAGTLLGQTIQQMTQLLGLPMSQLAPLIQALELQQSSSQSSSQGSSQGTSSRDPVTQSQSNSSGSRGSGGSRTGLGGAGGGGGGGELYDDTTYNGGGAEGEWNYYNPYGGGGGDDWNDYYNSGGDTNYNYNLNTEVEIPGLGGTQGGGYYQDTGDDYNDYYYNDTGF